MPGEQDAAPAQVSTTHRRILRPGYSSVSDHKWNRDHVTTRQKPLQNDFLTQHLYSAQNIRYGNTGSSKILDCIFYPPEVAGCRRNPD